MRWALSTSVPAMLSIRTEIRLTLMSIEVSLLFEFVSKYSSFSAGVFSELRARRCPLAEGDSGGAAATGTLFGALAGVRPLRRRATGASPDALSGAFIFEDMAVSTWGS